MICRIVLTRKRTPEKKEHVLYPLYLVCSGSLTVCCNPVLTLDRLSYNTLSLKQIQHKLSECTENAL